MAMTKPRQPGVDGLVIVVQDIYNYPIKGANILLWFILLAADILKTVG
jgi:hypothetical protein